MAASNVLIVDDEEKLRNLLKRIIGLEGFSVFEAPNLSQALTILNRNTIDIILCDVKLPDGSGVDFVSEVRLKYPGTPVILLTAFGNIADGVQAMKNGAFDYIVKGDDNDKIIPLLNRADELVAAMIRTSAFTTFVSPTLMNSLFSRTLNSFVCSSNGISPISSRNSVPLTASSINPFLSFIAPVNAPALCPKISLSSSSLENALQLMATNDSTERLLDW